MTMTSASAHALTKTYYCKAPGCQNEVRSPVGRYSYCAEHQGTAAPRAAAPRHTSAARSDGVEKSLRDLLSLAKRVDKAKAKADALLRTANEAGRAADELEDQYREALKGAIGA